jgi:hypothetical protein
MSEQYDENTPGEERTPAEWAQYRKSEKARKDAEREAENAKRELAFLKAGIPMDDPKTSYFVKGYEGELTVEAIREKAQADGFLAAEKAPEPDPDEATNAAALAAQQRQTLLAQGGLAVGATPGEQLLESAYTEGGDKAMLEQARQMGIRVVESQ